MLTGGGASWRLFTPLKHDYSQDHNDYYDYNDHYEDGNPAAC